MSAVQYWVVVPAAGAGQRFGGEKPKQYSRLGGKTLLEWSTALFVDDDRFGAVRLAIDPGDIHFDQLPLAKAPSVSRVTGGATRADSVLNALQSLSPIASPNDYVLVHDAARPLLHQEDLNALINTVADDRVGGILATGIVDTVKQVGGDIDAIHNANTQRDATLNRVAGVERATTRIDKTLDRNCLWAAQTPQMFRYGLLFDALSDALDSGDADYISDEASAVERAGESPMIVPAKYANFKVTTPRDLLMAEFFLADRRAQRNR